MSREMAEAFIRNLKLFNAKERDHLMRFAYLDHGDPRLDKSDPYESTSTFLSTKAEECLRTHAVDLLGLAGSPRCVFAGMDYHLDWLFAALSTAGTSPAWRGQGRDVPLSQPMASHEAETGLKNLYTDFRPLNGSQEDIDLLVVYDDGEQLAVLFIEAKGTADFDRVQLARKLIRLDRILVGTGMTSKDRLLKFRLILAAPHDPELTCYLKYAMDLPKTDKFRAMRDALLEDNHPSGIGKDVHFLKLTEFPKDTYAVMRERRDPEIPVETTVVELAREPGEFTHWALKQRTVKKRTVRKPE